MNMTILKALPEAHKRVHLERHGSGFLIRQARPGSEPETRYYATAAEAAEERADAIVAITLWFTGRDPATRGKSGDIRDRLRAAIRA